MANSEKVFAKGFNFTRRDNAPDWVVGKLSLKASEAIEFIKQNAGTEWLNLNICQGKQGNFYVELDMWKPTPKQDSASTQSFKPAPESGDDLPW
jgi:hypothetical protein